MIKDFCSQQREDYAGTYKDSNGNIYDLREYCGYWSLYLRVGENGHTKTIIDNSDLSHCLIKLQERGLVKTGKAPEQAAKRRKTSDKLQWEMDDKS